MNAMNIWDIHKELGLQKEHDYRWSGVYATGNFDAIEDYGAGLLTVSISVIADAKDVFVVLISISTIDDGGWQAIDIEKCDRPNAIVRMDAIAKSFIKFMDGSTKLPTEKDLNDYLMPMGLWGEYTG